MTKEAFGAELQKEREARQISLQDISAATRINVRFLEAIERGEFDVLPKAYVRAFIREYAETVGLNGDEVLAKLEGMEALAPRSRGASPEPAPPSRQVPDEAPKRAHFPGFQRHLSLQNVVLAVLALVAIAVIVSTIRWGSTSEATSNVTEIPFDKVIEESAATSQKQPASQALPGIVPPKPDSLMLEIQTRDSVWMRLVIDRNDTSEYLFGPERARTWVANNRFVLTVGNPSGAEFRLNGVPLGSLVGSDGRIRNREITAADLRRQ